MLNFLNYNTIIANYIFFNKNNFFLKKEINKDVYFLININKLNFLSIYFKLSFIFFTTNLLEYFAYNLINTKNILNKNITNIIVKNFFLLKKNLNIFLFTLKNNINLKIRKTRHYYNNIILSDESLFYVSIWSEREINEMNNIYFYGKVDNRNLLLIYSESIKPLLKSNPTIGFLEYFYNIFSNNINSSVINT